jgi:Flp pilus assembly pilin Flp
MNLITYLRLRFLGDRLRFLGDDSGQDLLEYALLVALIALVCVGMVTQAGEKARDIFQGIADQLPTPAAP